MEVGPIRRAAAIAVVLGAGIAGLAGCGVDRSIESSASTTTTTAAANQDPGAMTQGSVQEAVPVSDADLQRADVSEYNCGGKLRPVDQPADKFSGDYWVKYANDNPELAPKQMNFYDGLFGKDAVDSLLTNGYDNGLTSPDKKIASSERGDTLAHKMNAAQLQTDRVYANFTCIDGSGNVDIHRADRKPTIKVAAGGHVEGVVVDEAGIADFLSKAKRYSDGSPTAEVINIGQVTLANGEKKQMFMVTLKAFGCDNPIARLAPNVPGQPNKPGRPVKTYVPAQPKQPTKPGQPGHPTTTGLPNKVPRPLVGTMPHPQPGAGGSQDTNIPSNDSPLTGYGPEGPTSTLPRNPEAPATTAPATVETGPPRPVAPPVSIVTTTEVPQVPAPPLGN